jgi:hypothetical protein
MMIKFLFPWQNRAMIEYPWALPLFILSLSVILSLITIIREKKVNPNKKNKP